MAHGIIEYNSNGLPKCELCGKFFIRVLSHVRQKHNITAREYKKLYGFDLIKGIISEESRKKSREAVYKNYEEVISINLLHKGDKTRFKKGNQGRTRDQVSEQTKIMLTERAKNNMTAEHRRAKGGELGLSGKGNLKRWGKND